MTGQAELKSVTVNGADLHYVEQGVGEAVVFVHGGLGDYRTWRPQMGPISELYRAVSYSRRGHYPNAWLGDYKVGDMMLHAADLAALIEGLGLAPAHIVANSYGAYLSLFLALDHPQLVRTLSLAEPPVHPLLARIPGGLALLEEFNATAWLPARQAFSRGDLEGGVRLFIEGAVGTGEYEALPPKVREAMMKNAPEMAVSAMTDFDVHMPDLTCQDAARIQVPTLLMLGERSPKKYSLINAELARCMPNVEQASIPNAAHVLHSHNPAEHNRVVLAFLARHTTPLAPLARRAKSC